MVVINQTLEQFIPDRKKKEIERYALYYVSHILPMVRRRLELWYQRASCIKNPMQATLARESIKNKIKHPIATSIFVSSLKFSYVSFLLDKYIALALMLDYLDDVIDKGMEHNLNKVKNIQQAMVDALKPKKKQFGKYPKSEMLNLSYLKELVEVASKKIVSLPNYRRTSLYTLRAMEDFVKTQVESSLSFEERRFLAKNWAKKNFAKESGLTWFEHQAVQASPLRVYALLWLSTKPYITEDQIELINHVYIWFGGINVLGDQLNDLKEDQLKNEVNQIFEYKNKGEAEEGIFKMVNKAYNGLDQLPNSSFHLFILTALVNLYMQPLLGTDWHKIANILCKKFNGGENFINKILYSYDKLSFCH